MVLAAPAVVCSREVLDLSSLGHVSSFGVDFLLLSLVGPSVLIGAALAAARLPRRLGGVLLLAVFVPAVAAALTHAASALVVVDGRSAEPFGPLAWVGVAAQLLVIAVAIRWVTSSDTRHRRAASDARPGHEVPTI